MWSVLRGLADVWVALLHFVLCSWKKDDLFQFIELKFGDDNIHEWSMMTGTQIWVGTEIQQQYAVLHWFI